MRALVQRRPTAQAPSCKAADDLPANRLAREWKTMSAMVHIYCRDLHRTPDGPCPECARFLKYAHVRLERCRFGQEKPTCANCPVHCYQRARRDQARAIMRYAGQRMLWKHPLLSLRHCLDGFRKVPSLTNGPGIACKSPAADACRDQKS